MLIQFIIFLVFFAIPLQTTIIFFVSLMLFNKTEKVKYYAHYIFSFPGLLIQGHVGIIAIVVALPIPAFLGAMMHIANLTGEWAFFPFPYTVLFIFSGTLSETLDTFGLMLFIDAWFLGQWILTSLLLTKSWRSKEKSNNSNSQTP